MATEANEDQIRDLVAKMQAYQARMEALQQQANLIQASVNDVDAALKAISSLEGAAEGTELLVPIGAGSFVHATIAKPDKVLVGLGADVSVERSVADARNIFQARRTELEKALAETNGVLNQVAGELMKLQQEAEKYRQ